MLLPAPFFGLSILFAAPACRHSRPPPLPPAAAPARRRSRSPTHPLTDAPARRRTRSPLHPPAVAPAHRRTRPPTLPPVVAPARCSTRSLSLPFAVAPVREADVFCRKFLLPSYKICEKTNNKRERICLAFILKGDSCVFGEKRRKEFYF